MADDVILREQIMGFRGSPILAMPLYNIIPPLILAEILDTIQVMNRVVAAIQVMNRVVDETYSELEDVS